MDLQLSGHTHGGQIYLPLLGAPWVRSPGVRLPSRGLSRHGNATLYINRGLGTILFPIRFLSPPEITVIKIQGTRKAARKE
ncbi:MAG: phosphodiesterase YaeI [bacterium ADurb.Bin478]|nr:MAG: phosphodiesterase YaeI [bacterium ADurb.Bin478]